MKVLIVSHNPISTYQNMGKTMLSLFSDFSKDELCQFYIYPTVPDADVCASYYRITDRNILKSIFKFGKVESRVIDAADIDKSKHEFFESAEDEKLLSRKKSYFKLLVRDVLWKCARWNDNNLKSWLANQKPDRIFLAPGESKFIYDIALAISKEMNIPIFTYICDEFYFVNPPRGLVGRIHFILLHKKIEKLMKHCNGLVTICDELSNAYGDKFHVPASTVYTGTTLHIGADLHVADRPLGITYLGNLAFGRLDSIIDVAAVLQRINEDTGNDFKLFLYTPLLSDRQRELIKTVPTIEYKGFVVGNEYEKVLLGSDLLLHVESFKEEYVNRVKHSVSTKIADSLSSGVPLVAYAPYRIASMNYLRNENCAFCADNKEDLKKVLSSALFNNELRRSMSKSGVNVAQKNHCAKDNSARLRSIINV